MLRVISTAAEEPLKVLGSRFRSLTRRSGLELVFYAGVYSLTSAVLRLCGFIVSLWIARSLTIPEYAWFGLCYAMQSGVSAIVPSGIIESVVGSMHSTNERVRRHSLFAAGHAAFSVMALITAAVAYLLFGLSNESSIRNDWTVSLVVLSSIFLAFATLQAQIVRLEEKPIESLAFSFVVPFAGVIGGAAAFLLQRTVGAVFLGMTIATAGALSAISLTRAGRNEGQYSVQQTLSVLRGMRPYIAIAALGWVTGYGNSYLINAFFSTTEVARFTFALMVCSVLQMVATALNQVWSPQFFRLLRENETVAAERDSRRFFKWMGIVLGLTGGCLLAMFPAAVALVGGSLVEYRSMTLELLLLVMAYVVLPPWWHCYNYYLAHSEGSQALRITVVTSVLGLAGWFALTYVFGALGIYLGFLLQMVLRTVWIVAAARRRWPVGIPWDGVAIGLLLTLSGFVIARQ